MKDLVSHHIDTFLFYNWYCRLGLCGRGRIREGLRLGNTHDQVFFYHKSQSASFVAHIHNV
jgi:hypothetical protein